MSLIDKILPKEIMKLMKFRNKFLKVRMEENKKRYVHGEINVLLSRNTKKRIF